MLTGETVKTQPDWSMVHLFMLENLSGQPFYAMRQSARRLKEPNGILRDQPDQLHVGRHKQARNCLHK